MTKKDYVALAWALRYAREFAVDKIERFVPDKESAKTLSDGILLSYMSQIETVLQSDNSKFDKDRFEQFVMSQCINCGGPIEKTDQNVCNTCYKNRERA